MTLLLLLRSSDGAVIGAKGTFASYTFRAQTFDADTLQGATANTLTPPLIASGEVMHAPAVTVGGRTLSPPLLSDADTLHTATVTRGAVTLAPPLIPSGNSFFNPTVGRGAVGLSPPLLSDGDTLHAPSVAVGAVSLSPPLLSDGDTFFSPTLKLFLLPPVISDGDTLHTPTVGRGAVNLSPPLLSDADTLFSPGVSEGGLLLLPDVLGVGPELLVNWDFEDGGTAWNVANEDATHIVTFSDGRMRYQSDTISPVLSVNQAVEQVEHHYHLAIEVQAVVSGGMKVDAREAAKSWTTVGLKFFNPYTASSNTFSLTRNTTNVDMTLEWVSLREILSTTYTPAVTYVIHLSPPLLSDGDTLHAPTVTRGAVGLAPPLIASTNAFHNPTVGRGAVNLAPPLLDRNILLNFDFSNGLTNWVVSVGGTSTITAEGGGARIQSLVGGGAATIRQNVLVPGMQYFVEFDVTQVNGGGVKFEQNGGAIKYSTTALGHHTFYFVADTIAAVFNRTTSGITDITIDNVVITPVVGVPEVRNILYLFPTLLSDADSLHAPTASVGGVTLSPPLCDDGDTLHIPAVLRDSNLLWVKHEDEWEKPTGVFARHSGSWQPVVAVYVKEFGTWKLVYAP